MRWRNVLLVAAVVLPLLALLAAGFWFDPREVPSVLPGRLAPECRLQSLEGAPSTIAELRGRPVVLNFWSTWCVPCEAEHRLLQSAARAYGDRVTFVGVVYQDEPEAARRYLAKNGAAYRQLIDPASRCSIEYGVAGVPETFFIDGAGVVRHKQAGPVSAKVLRDAIDPLLAGGSP